MSRKDYKRSVPASFVPRSSALSESEHQEVLLRRVGTKQYYADRRRQSRKDADVSAEPFFQLESERQYRVKLRKKADRLELIHELMRLRNEC